MSPEAWLLQNGLIAAAATGALLLLLRLRRPHPGLEHLFWLAIVLKLVLPPIAIVPAPDVALQSPVAVGLVEMASSGSAPGIATVERATGAEARPSATSGPGSAGRPCGTCPAAGGSAGSSGGESIDAGDEVPVSGLAWLLFATWAIGALFTAGRTGLGYVSFRRSLEHGGAPEALESLVSSVASDLGIDSPELAVSDGVETPVLVGFAPPVLVWPADLGLDEEKTRTVVAHELAHLRRRDHWSAPVEFVAEIVWWWYPVWWLARRRLREAAELACDAVVVRAYPEQRKAYAEALLDVLSLRAGAQPGLGFGVVRPRSMRSRLREILTDRPGRRSRIAYAFLAIAALALVPTWTSGPPMSAAAVTADDASADGPWRAEPWTRVEGVASRGVVRFTEGEELPVLEPDGWFVAFSDPASGPVRRLVIRRHGQDAPSVHHRIGDRGAPVDSSVSEWLTPLLRRTSYDPATTHRGRPATAGWVPDGPHAHRTDGTEMLATWSSIEPGPGEGEDGAGTGGLAGPIHVVHQVRPGDPVVYLTIAHSTDGSRVTDAVVDAAPVEDPATVDRWLRRVTDRARAWSLPHPSPHPRRSVAPGR